MLSGGMGQASAGVPFQAQGTSCSTTTGTTCTTSSTTAVRPPQPSTERATKYRAIEESTEFYKDSFPKDAVNAHQNLLQEFNLAGAAHISHKRSLFVLDEEALARSMETLGIVATLIAAFSFTSLISPPGGWQQGDNVQVQAAALLDGTAQTPFKVFVYSDTVALAASMALVLVLAIGNSFGWKAQDMLSIFYVNCVMLAIAVLSAFMAFIAASWMLCPTEALVRWTVLSVCIGALAAAVVILLLLVYGVRRRAWQSEHKLRLDRLLAATKAMLSALRALNNSYFTYYGNMEYPVEALYFRWYSVIVIMTVIPLLEAFLTKVENYNMVMQSRALSNGANKLRQYIQYVISNYNTIWIKNVSNEQGTVLRAGAVSGHVGVWDVGINKVKMRSYKRGGDTYLQVVGGTTILKQHDVRLMLVDLRQAAIDLAGALIGEDAGVTTGEIETKSEGYCGKVKSMFLHTNLNRMMPLNIRLAKAT